MPAVSVVIPTYNHRDFVVAALESVFAQTFADYEIIVVNDGSPDDTAAVLKPYADAGRIRYLEQPNTGQAAARNGGVGVAAGEFVAFLDDDDLWPADKLEWQVRLLRENDWLAVGGTCVRFGDGRADETVGGPTRMVRLVELFNGNPFHSPGQVLVRRDALAALGGFDPGIWGVEDLDLYMRLAARGGFAAVDRPALMYRLHEANASNRLGRMFRNGTRAVRKNLPLVPEPDRPRARRDGFRWVYDYLGSRIVAGSLRSPRRWPAAVDVWARLVGPAVLDRGLFKAILWGVLPLGLRRRLRPASFVATP